MIFTSLQVKNFGVLKGPLAVTFGPGLNVIHGPNEAGKSTLVGALWAALTLRHRVGGDIRQARAYVPRSGGVPEVLAGFEHKGLRYSVEKRFAGQRGSARLRVWHPDGREEDLADADAENRLQQILGTTPGADGKRDEELGVLPLLWVRQERAALLPSQDLHEGGRAALAEQLGRLSGEMLGGPDAEQLFEGARGERDRYYTPTGQVRRSADGPFFASFEAQRAAEDRLSRLSARKADHEALLDRQEQITARIDALDARIPGLETAAREAAARAETLRALREQVAHARKSVEIATARAAAARRRWEERSELRGRLLEARTALETLEQAARKASAAAAGHSAIRADREAALRTAEVEDARQRRLWERADTHLEVLRRRAELDRRAEELERARGLVTALAEGRKKLSGLKIEAATVQRMDALERQTVTAEAALEAASAQVRVTALAEVGVVADGRPYGLGPNQEHTWKRVDRPFLLRISELVEVEVVPGGRDLDELRRKAEEPRAALEAAFAAAGVRSVADARALAEERRALVTQTEGLARQLEAFGPGGADALARGLEQVKAELSARERARAAATREGDPPLPADLALANGARADTTTARERARLAVQAARDALGGFEREAVGLDAEKKRADERLREAQSRIGQIAAALTRGLAEDGEDPSLQRGAAEAGDALAQEREALAGLSASLDAQNPEAVDAALAESNSTLRAAVAERDALARDRAEVLGALSAADLVGLHERLAAARAEAEAAADQLRRLQEQAETARLLYETLDQQRNTARERYLGPLQRETERMLRLLFPEASLVFDDRFQLTQINRAETDTFDVLSVGTREQIGVVVRLAMASVLAGDGPLTVILDDALVATDEKRFLRMIPVLSDAAQRLQILMLTCHWSRYEAVGKVADRVIDLEVLKGGVG